MSDRVLKFKCVECSKTVIDFDPPEECPHCGSTKEMREHFDNIGTRLATEGLMCEFVLDNVHEYDMRNDIYTEEYLEDKTKEQISKMRSDR